MRPLDWIDAGGLVLGLLLGFIAWRLFEIVQLSGARLRHRRAVAELREAEEDWRRCARAVRRSLENVDERQRSRATIARELAEARGDGSDRDWLGKKDNATLTDAIFGDQTDALAPERASDDRL